MKNLKRYVYANVLFRILVPFILVIGLSVYFKRWEPIAAYAVIILFVLFMPLRKMRRLEKARHIQETEILRDFVTAEKCGRWIVGERFAYILMGFTLEVFDVNDITWAYGIEHTSITQDAHERRVKKKTMVSVWIKDTREIKVDMKMDTIRTFFIFLQRSNPSVKIGYDQN